MKPLPDYIFSKVEHVARKVFDDLRNKGHIMPVKEEDGSIRFDRYVVKKYNNFYKIFDKNNDIVVDKINLPQSAAIIANKLALGKMLDNETLNLDKAYGYKLFEEQLNLLAKKRKKNTADDIIYYHTRYEIAKVKREYAKERIMESFRKLTAIK